MPVQLEQGAEDDQLEVSVHRGDGLVICEFEPGADEPFRFSSFYPGVRRALLRLESTRTVTDLCQAAVRSSGPSPAMTGWWPTVSTGTDRAR